MPDKNIITFVITFSSRSRTLSCVRWFGSTRLVSRETLELIWQKLFNEELLDIGNYSLLLGNINTQGFDNICTKLEGSSSQGLT